MSVFLVALGLALLVLTAVSVISRQSARDNRRQQTAWLRVAELEREARYLRRENALLQRQLASASSALHEARRVTASAYRTVERAKRRGAA